MEPDRQREEAQHASSRIVRAIEFLVWLGGALSTLLILAVLATVSYAITQRYVIDRPLLWADELIGYTLVAIVMLGAAEALRRDDHIAIDLLAARASPRRRRWLAVWSNVTVLVFAAALGWSTWEAISFAYDFGSYSIGYIEIATWIPQVPMMIGSVLLALVALTRILQLTLRGEDQ